MTAFLIIPNSDPPEPTDWQTLDRAQRLSYLRQALLELQKLIDDRLPEADVDYLDGIGGWTVRTHRNTSRSQMLRRLKGLPVAVSEDAEFTSLT